MTDASQLYEYYLELRQIRSRQYKKLESHQKRVQRYERQLIDVRIRIGKCLADLDQEQTKLSAAETWVTADVHETIQTMQDALKEEYSDLVESIQLIRDRIDFESKQAKQFALHIDKIDKGLLFLEEQMREQLSPKAARKQKSSKPVQVFLKRTSSQYSFNSIMSASSTNSVSLAGTLLKKWLTPRLQPNNSKHHFAL